MRVRGHYLCRPLCAGWSGQEGNDHTARRSTTQGRATAMNNDFVADGTDNQGRKGLAYDWQSLFAATAVTAIEAQLASMTPVSVD